MYLQYPTFEGRSQTTKNTFYKRTTGRYKEWDDLGFVDGKRGGEVDERSGEKVQPSPTIHHHPNSTTNHMFENGSVGGLGRKEEPSKRGSSGNNGEWGEHIQHMCIDAYWNELYADHGR